MQKVKFERVRFHIEFGPPSLFERVYYIMKDKRKLYLESKHFRERFDERQIPIEILKKLQEFNIDEWVLKTAEVRADRGKFVNSTWERVIDGVPYWVTIGLGECIMTVVIKESSGVDKCVRDGDYYDFVESVNRKLMDDDLVVEDEKEKMNNW